MITQLLRNPIRKSPTDFQSARDAAANREIFNLDFVNDTNSLFTDSNREDTPFDLGQIENQPLDHYPSLSDADLDTSALYGSSFQMIEPPFMKEAALDFSEYTSKLKPSNIPADNISKKRKYDDSTDPVTEDIFTVTGKRGMPNIVRDEAIARRRKVGSDANCMPSIL